MVMLNLNQAKLMNEENWTKIETTEMRNNVKKKTKKKTEEWEKRSLDLKWKKKEKGNKKQQQQKRGEMSRNIEEIIIMV